MKKLVFLLTFAFVACCAFAQASYKAVPNAKPTIIKKQSGVKFSVNDAKSVKNASYLLQEGFDNGAIPADWTLIDADGDGSNWGFYSVAPHSGAGSAFSASYYNYTALSPDNWLISPAIEIPEGTTTLSWWEASQDPNYPDPYKAYVLTSLDVTDLSGAELIYSGTAADEWTRRSFDLSSFEGQTVYVAFRHNDVSDQFYVKIDDVQVLNVNGTSVWTDITSIVFAGIDGSIADAEVSVLSLDLTEDITATTASPFLVSSDGENFAATATIPQDGGTLYVRIDAIGETQTLTGSVSLVSGEATATIAISANVIYCGAVSAPYIEEFVAGGEHLSCWNIIDGNNDGKTFLIYHDEDGYSLFDDDYGVFYEYSEDNNAEEWLISPLLNVAQQSNVKFSYKGYGYPERFEAYILTDLNDLSTAVLAIEATDVTNTEFEVAEYIIPDEYIGQEIYFAIKCTSDADQYYFFVDSFQFKAIGVPYLVATPSSLTMRGVLGETSDAIVNISGEYITEDITVTTAAPFAVSADGVDFAETATLDATAEMFYVRFTPATEGEVSGNVNIATGVASVDVVVNATAYDCSNPDITEFPFVENFDAGLPACWTYIDADGDGYGWNNIVEFMTSTGNAAYISAYANGADAACSLSALMNGTALETDNYMITPKVVVPAEGTVILTYTAKLFNSGAPEVMNVKVSTTGNDAADFETTLLVDNNMTGAFVERSISLAAYAGQEIYIAFEHINNNSFGFALDDVALTLVSESSITVEPATMSFNTIFGSATVAQTAEIVAYNLTEAIVATATENFEVSADGEDFAATASIDQLGGTLYVRYNPAEAGEHTGTVTLASGESTANIALSGVAVACENITEFPFEEDFENGISDCWLNIDADGDTYVWLAGEAPGHGDSGNAAISQSYVNYVGAVTPDNWLITPAFEIPAGSNYELTFFVAAQDESWAAEHYGVYISTTTTDLSAFQLVYEETIDANGGSRAEGQGAWKQKHVDLASYAGQTIYVAWRHFNCTDQFIFLLDDVYVGMKTAAEESVMSEVAVYPNPANDIVTIANVEGSNVVVLNALGQVVSEINNASANQTIDLSNFANGTYFVKANGQVVKFNVVK
ncbi:MAG: T9SS type A sorting domain-containing protein [Bacteroidales bacterium]|nr:T9SS type A sorting domain-containing protein [Bacteroidales bacterium]